MRPWDLKAGEDYAELAPSMWSLSKELSDAIRPHLPSDRDCAMELLKHLPAGVELSAKKLEGRCVLDEQDPEMLWMREKHYAVAYLSHEDAKALDVDRIRGAVFAAVKVFAERITKSVEAVRVKRQSRLPECVLPVMVGFVTAGPVRYVNNYGDDIFVAYDPCSDSVAIRMATYFCAYPGGF